MSKKKWLKSLSFLLVLMMLLSLSACTTDDQEKPEDPPGEVGGEPIELDFLHVFTGPRGEALAELVNNFNASQDGIIVSQEHVPGWYGGLLEQLQTMSVAKQLPDITIGALSNHNFMMDGLNAVSLQSFIDQENYDTSAIFPQMLSLGTNDAGDQVALPFAISTPLLYANKDMMKEAGIEYVVQPESWEDIEEWAFKLAALGPEKSGLAFQLDFDTWQYQTLVETFGGKMASIEDKEILFTEAPGQKVMDFWMRLKEGKVWPNMSGSEAGEEFMAGDMGMIMATTGNLVSFTQNTEFDMGIMLLPLYDNTKDKNTRVVPAGGSNIYVLTQDEERAAAAWEFVKYVMSAEAGEIIVKDLGYMAARQELLEESDVLADYRNENPQALRSYEQIVDLSDWYNWPGVAGARIDSIFLDNFDAAFLGQKTGQEALNDVAKEAKELLGW